MTKAMDSFYFDESKIDNISSKVLLISFDDDLLFPAKDMVEFHKLLKLKGDVRMIVLFQCCNLTVRRM